MLRTEIASLWSVTWVSLQLITGDEVNAVDLPLDIDLLGVHMAVDGRILIAGRDGICAEVSNGELLEIEAPNSTFFSVTQFKGATYWGTLTSGYSLKRVPR